MKEGQECGGNPCPKIKKNEPRWKRRLEGRVASLRQDADILKAWMDKRLTKDEAYQKFQKVVSKYKCDGSRAAVEACLFRIKNQISATAGKIKRYLRSIKVKEQNDLFQLDKKQFFRSLFESSQKVVSPPKAEEIRAFWEGKIWGDASKYTEKPAWMDEVEKTYKGIQSQKWERITENDVKKQLSGAMNWKAPGHDKIPNFWLKSLPSIHACVAQTLNQCVEHTNEMPDWIVKGKTTLLPKSDKTTDASQYRPITCLTTMWKCLTGIIGDKIATFMNSNGMLAVEQQGGIKKSYGTKTQLLINRNILSDAYRSRKNLHMLYVDYQKAYDSVPHAWIKESLTAYKISPTIINFICTSMLMWKVDLTLYYEGGCVKVGNVLFQRGIFHGDSLSPLIFIIALNPLSLIINRRCSGYKMGNIWISHLWYMDDLKGYSNSYANLVKMANLIETLSSDIGMEFGLSKCKVINMVNGRYKSIGGITIQSGGIMEELSETESYKYLGIEELDSIKHSLVKEKVSKNVKSKLQKLLESELNARNLFHAINESILPIITYTFGVIDWNEEELKGYDVQMRKMLNMYRAFELKSDKDRLYLPRSDGGRGLISVWDSFQSSTCRIAHAITHSDNLILVQCIENEKKGTYSNITRANKYEENMEISLPENFQDKPYMTQARLKAKAMKNAITKSRLITYKQKPQHGAFARMLDESGADRKLSMAWLKKSFLDPFTESYICGAQELAVITKYHEKHILKNSHDDLCRVCKKDPESVYHILGACDALAKREYFDRHNNICKYIHYKISQHYDLDVGDNWYKHKPADVIIKPACEIIYDQVIKTTRPVGANRPDIIVKDMKKKKAYIIDISCPVDFNVGKKEGEKVAKYMGLSAELNRMWGTDTETIPVIVGGLGTVSKNLGGFLTTIPGLPDLFMCQKICLLGSKKILQDTLRCRR